jgi:hypothetical protein
VNELDRLDIPLSIKDNAVLFLPDRPRKRAKGVSILSEDKAAPGRFNDLLSKLLMSILLQPT